MMFKQSFMRAVTATLTALIFTATFVLAQDNTPALKITRPASTDKLHNRITRTADLDQQAAFARLHPTDAVRIQTRSAGRSLAKADRVSTFSIGQPVASAPVLLSLATGGGDIDETEPNDLIAESVSLPVNVFGKIRVNRDIDFFAFQALAGEQITIEAFAARFSRSKLIADLALFDASSNLLAADVGDETVDPIIRFTPSTDQVLIVGITDADNFGGSRFDYLLNLTRGNDVDETEPNGNTAQSLASIPATVFGEISAPSDVDFYSFTATAGQTLIVDVDAEVLGSRLDAEINLLDPESGAEFFYNDQQDGDDPRFNIVLPYTGRYVIGIGAFNVSSTGFYRLNASLVAGTGAPSLTSVTRVSKKLIQVTGLGLASGAVVSVNGTSRKTTVIAPGLLQAKVKAHAGDVVTVANPPDGRRSNPLVVQ